MADYTPPFDNDAQPFPVTASGAIVGGNLVFANGVGTAAATAGANGAVLGVAAQDAASGVRVAVWPIPGLIHETTNANAGSLTAGSPITSGTSGGVDTGTLGTLAAAGTLIGTALTTAATGAKVRWLGR